MDTKPSLPSKETKVVGEIIKVNKSGDLYFTAPTIFEYSKKKHKLFKAGLNIDFTKMECILKDKGLCERILEFIEKTKNAPVETEEVATEEVATEEVATETAS